MHPKKHFFRLSLQIFTWLAVIACSLCLLPTNANSQTSDEIEEARYQQILVRRKTVSSAEASTAAGQTLILESGDAASACPKAMPLLVTTLKILNDLSDVDRKSFGRSGEVATWWLGFCSMKIGNFAEAIRWLDRVAGPASSFNKPAALACLGDIYANGLGVPEDRMRALAFYVSSAESCPVSGKESKREAAEIILAINPDAGLSREHPAIKLLCNGGPKNWLRAVQVLRGKSGNRSNDMDLVFQGIHTGSFSAIELGEEDRSALRTLSLMFGKFRLEEGHLATAYASLHAADGIAAQDFLAKLQDRLPYRLIMANNQIWSAFDEAR